MDTGHVTTTALNLRASAGGAIIGVLRQNCAVTILGRSDGWLNVSAKQDGADLSGWASANFIATGAAASPAAPPGAPPVAPLIVPPIADDATHKVTVQGNRAIGPGGDPFATRQTMGFYGAGSTTLRQWVAQTAGDKSLSPSVSRVLQAVSTNEGELEAINSYDNSFLSFGMLQWTMGAGDDPGELAALLAKLKTLSPDTFADCFGRYGLDVDLPPSNPASLRTGFVKLNGALIDTAAAKETLRAVEWAYRFWRAGHFEPIRDCQAELSADRIPLARGGMIRNVPVSEWLTSEHGVALLLDEHVNRPGHLPHTLQSAVAALPEETPADPAHWGDQQEAALIRAYVMARDATSMTDPDGRAKQIAAAVQRGLLSDARGSYVP